MQISYPFVPVSQPKESGLDNSESDNSELDNGSCSTLPSVLPTERGFSAVVRCGGAALVLGIEGEIFRVRGLGFEP